MVARDGPDAGSTAGDDPAEIKNLFRSDAKYYEPAGAVSWDVAMKATPRDWRISLKQGDRVFINVAYDVRKASWYESMGILPLAWVPGHPDPAAKDPFDDAAAVQDMYDEGGVLTHRRLTENIDTKARKDLGLPNPRKLKSKGTVPASGIDIRSFSYLQGGFTAVRGFPHGPDASPGHQLGRSRSPSPTSMRSRASRTPIRSGTASPPAGCPATRARGSATRSPTARSSSTPASSATEPAPSSGVTTGSNVYTTPPLTYQPNRKGKKATTFAYFCRIHPLMRGSIRVRK